MAIPAGPGGRRADGDGRARAALCEVRERGGEQSAGEKIALHALPSRARTLAPSLVHHPISGILPYAADGDNVGRAVAWVLLRGRSRRRRRGRRRRRRRRREGDHRLCPYACPVPATFGLLSSASAENQASEPSLVHAPYSQCSKPAKDSSRAGDVGGNTVSLVRLSLPKNSVSPRRL